MTIEIFDDTDGSQAGQTVPFGLDGVSYEIDLSDSNADALRAALKPYVSVARRTGGRRIKVAVGQSTESAKEEPQATNEYTSTHSIRSWARDNGHEVADRGRISPSIVEAYHASHNANRARRPQKSQAGSKAKSGTKLRK